ncbi:hypothetical protein O6P43_006768 [Quillaja saponaria]|uniref:Uncharacterized protein n=1 Tax=Quillaja saponaria TaxID=32244 RepID=A0AAD7Q8Z9_QUISA|nr:hypothetical protein O6P43_006768 [Quillaja saponaria]
MSCFKSLVMELICPKKSLIHLLHQNIKPYPLQFHFPETLTLPEIYSVRKLQHGYGFSSLNRIFQPGHPLVLDSIHLTSRTIATRKSQSGREQIYAKLSKENFLNQGNMVAMGLRVCEVMRSSILFFRINFLANGFEFVGCRFF